MGIHIFPFKLSMHLLKIYYPDLVLIFEIKRGGSSFSYMQYALYLSYIEMKRERQEYAIYAFAYYYSDTTTIANKFIRHFSSSSFFVVLILMGSFLLF
jgi:hypothetical protein